HQPARTREGRSMKTKMILMVVAVACGLGASYMTRQLLAGRGQGDQDEPTKGVLVARTRIAPWQPIKEPEQGVEGKDYPERLAPKAAVTSLAKVKDKRFKNVVEEGKPVTEDDLLSKEQEGLAAQMKPGQQAIAIKVNAETLSGGFIRAGDRVNVICTTKND